MLIPHSSGEVKTFKISSFYVRLALIGAAVLFILVCTGIFITYSLYSNNTRLNADILKLSEMGADQKSLLDEKAKEIDELRQREEATNQKIKSFEEKYRELTDNYINKGASSRSGDRSDRAFIDGINELKGILGSLNESGSAENTPLSKLSETETKLNKYMESIPSLWPTAGRVSSTFGGRRDPFQSKTRFHEGLDIAAPYGQNIKASASGVVSFSGWQSGYGYVIIINHGHGMSTLYGHTSKLLAKVGQTVKKGDVIARVGSSGRSTGSHLHFEIRINDNPIDPKKYLDK